MSLTTNKGFTVKFSITFFSQVFYIDHWYFFIGNSSTGNVEGYATVADIIKIPYSQITNYENQHRASQWLIQKYKDKTHLYGYVLKDVKKEANPFPYPKSHGISFNIKAEKNQ